MCKIDPFTYDSENCRNYINLSHFLSLGSSSEARSHVSSLAASGKCAGPMSEGCLAHCWFFLMVTPMWSSISDTLGNSVLMPFMNTHFSPHLFEVAINIVRIYGSCIVHRMIFALQSKNQLQQALTHKISKCKYISNLYT